MKKILTIAGSDCSGGAGIQADIKTITMHGMYAMSAITALTAQNTTGVYGIMNSSADFLKNQIDCIFNDIRPDAVKIGMVSDVEIIEAIAQKLKEYKAVNIVADPVMVATSGSRLISEDATDALMTRLLPLADIITPNLAEAEVLTGMKITTREEMEKAANHLLSLINDVLQMSKLEDGREELSSELVCLPDVFYDMKAIIDGSALDKGISVDFSEDSIWVHPYVITNPLYLRQIFLNIYGNSIKFTNFGGKISTKQECIEEKDNVITYRWIISDTGIGMSKEFLKHIFEPFAQERADARSNYHGTGLGMAIVKKMIDKMGGTISVTSEVGKGSTFVVELPFEMGAAPEKSKKEEADKENSIHGLNLMLVEDNELNAEVAEILLEDEGAIITMVNDGQQAVELFNNNPVGTFDAILMDIMMPVMDGLTATKAIRALNRPDAGIIPIIAMTANDFAEDVQRCLDAGMNAHLAKPLDIEKVKKTICEHTIELYNKE
mgnify:CR=1 FL=1